MPLSPSPAAFPARATIDLDAIRHNARELKARAGSAETMAVVKANAYGHGLVQVARAAQQGGATWVGVAQAEEALELRSAGITGRLMAWLLAPSAPWDALLNADVDVSASAPWAIDAIADAARRTGRQARVHLKIDTGMGRGGSPFSQWETLVDAALAQQANGTIAVVGVWSHLACADQPERPITSQQIEVFESAVKIAEAKGAKLEVRHLANSAATLAQPRAHYDLVRPGIALYGLSPFGREPVQGESDAIAMDKLVPAMTLDAELALVKNVPAGQGVSYGLTYTAPSDTRLAVVPIGYGDGLLRSASGRGEPLPGGGAIEGGLLAIGDHRTRIAGRICMDQFVIDLGRLGDPAAAPDLQSGDRVTLFGPRPLPTADQWAEQAGTIGYEIVTRLTGRIERVWLNEHPTTTSTATNERTA